MEITPQIQSAQASLGKALEQLIDEASQKLDKQGDIDERLRWVNTRLEVLESNPKEAAKVTLSDYFELQKEQRLLEHQYHKITAELAGLRETMQVVSRLKTEAMQVAWHLKNED